MQVADLKHQLENALEETIMLRHEVTDEKQASLEQQHRFKQHIEEMDVPVTEPVSSSAESPATPAKSTATSSNASPNGRVSHAGSPSSRRKPRNVSWYLVHAPWILSWRKYITGADPERPGLIDNSTLVRHGEFRRSAEQGKDYVGKCYCVCVLCMYVCERHCVTAVYGSLLV
jgi:DUSP domain